MLSQWNDGSTPGLFVLSQSIWRCSNPGGRAGHIEGPELTLADCCLVVIHTEMRLNARVAERKLELTLQVRIKLPTGERETN